MAGYTRQSAATIATGGNQYINFGQDTGTSGESWSTAIVGNALGVSRTVGFYCEIPITGW